MRVDEKVVWDYRFGFVDCKILDWCFTLRVRNKADQALVFSCLCPVGSRIYTTVSRSWLRFVGTECTIFLQNILCSDSRSNGEIAVVKYSDASEVSMMCKN